MHGERLDRDPAQVRSTHRRHGRYYEVAPIARAAPTLADALLDVEAKIERYQQDMQS
jgi:hypothetical protein